MKRLALLASPCRGISFQYAFDYFSSGKATQKKALGVLGESTYARAKKIQCNPEELSWLVSQSIHIGLSLTDQKFC